MSNPDKPNLEAALSSTPAAAKKSRFRPTFRSPRIPRETKLGLGIIFSLVCVFGYVLYSRLTRPAEMDAEQFAAQSKSVLAPSVTSDQSTALAVQPTGQQPTVLPGAAPQHTLPLASSAAPTAAVPTQYGAPTSTTGLTTWTPNSSNSTTSTTATASSDPFMNRGAATPAAGTGAASSFSANGFGANSNTAGSSATTASTPSYGLSDNKEPSDVPSNSFMPPADRVTASGATAGTTSLSANAVMPEASATSGSLPGSNAVDAFNKTATDSLNKLKQEGQTLVNSGSSAQNELGKAADSATQMLGQAQQQFGQYTSSAATNANTMLNQAGQTATQYGTDLKKEVQTQASQYTNQLQNAAQDQFQQAQNQLRANANTLVNDTTNQLRSTTESVMTKAGDTTQNLMNSATTSLTGGQPLSPLPTTSASTGTAQPAGYGMPASTAPRTLDQSQTVSQPLDATASTNTYGASQPEQPIRIPTDSRAQPTTQPASMTQPNYGTTTTGMTQPSYGATSTTATAPNYGATTSPNYGSAPTTPNYGTMPATNGAVTSPTPSGTPLQFNPPTMPATQPATPAYTGATRTNFEQPAASTSPASRGGVQQYTVTAQDSYYSVAEKMYGNGAYNKALYEYNRRNNPAADRLQVGGAMLVPDMGTLQAQFPDLVPQAAATATINPTPLQFPR